MFILEGFNHTLELWSLIPFVTQLIPACNYCQIFLFSRRIFWKMIILIGNFLSEISKEACINLFTKFLLSFLLKHVDAIHLFIIFKERRLVYHETKNSQLNVISFFHLVFCFFRLWSVGGVFSWKDKQVIILSWIYFWHSVCDGEWICTPKTILSANMFEGRNDRLIIFVEHRIRVGLVHLPFFVVTTITAHQSSF